MSNASDNRSADPVPGGAPPAAAAGRERDGWLRWLRELVVMAAIAGAVLLVVGWVQRERQRGGGGALAVAATAPLFSVERVGGGRVALAELRGKPLVLVFWATWCGVCREEMPALEAFARRAAGRYEVLALSREGQATLAAWAGKDVHALRLASDPQGGAFAAYRVESLPTHVIIDAQGRIVHDFSGAADLDILAEHMRRLER